VKQKSRRRSRQPLGKKTSVCLAEEDLALVDGAGIAQCYCKQMHLMASFRIFRFRGSSMSKYLAYNIYL
jgi:hypothetical protein